MGCYSAVIEERCKNFVSAIGENRFGMKLNPKNEMLSMLDRHDDSVIGPGRSSQGVRQGLRINDKGMISANAQRIAQACHQSRIAMMNPGGMAMHWSGRAYDAGSQGLRDGLMSEADA